MYVWVIRVVLPLKLRSDLSSVRQHLLKAVLLMDWHGFHALAGEHVNEIDGDM